MHTLLTLKLTDRGTCDAHIFNFETVQQSAGDAHNFNYETVREGRWHCTAILKLSTLGAGDAISDIWNRPLVQDQAAVAGFVSMLQTPPLSYLFLIIYVQ